MTITEDDRRAKVPARQSTGTYDCRDDGNCFLTEANGFGSPTSSR